MTQLDPRFYDSALRKQARINAESPERVHIVRVPELPPGSAGSAVTAFHFTLQFRHIGAATLPLTWLLSLSEALCAPLEGLEISYDSEGGVATKCWYDSGWALPDGFELFIDLLEGSARVAAFEWSLEVLPHYSHLAARAVADPDRFRRMGKLVRDSLLRNAAWIIPEVECPCAYRADDVHGIDDSVVRRSWTAGILQRLRSGSLG